LYWRYPAIAPRNYHAIFVMWLVGLAAMGLCWRGLLVRRQLGRRALAIVDLAFTASSGVVFGVTAVLAYDRHEPAFTCLIYACFVVFMRALILPSTARWTALVSSFAMVPLAVAAGILAASTKQEIPALVFFVSGVVFSGLAVVIATVGSRLIYGLRRRVTENMRLGQYTLERKIGEGGSGAVYRATHALLRRPTAIKLMHPDRTSADALVRFEREVQQMSELTHPNTVAVYDYGHSPDGVFYYVMEHIDGIDLERLVAVHGRQAPTRIADILGQICGALHEAHHRGLVHRDVKPANILLCERGGADVAKVVDFGLAREIEDGVAGPAADVHALGAVGYFLLTGERVVSGDSPGIDPPLEALLLECLSKDPGARPSAERLAASLSRLPRTGWDEHASRTWWQAAREVAPGVAAGESAMTITVDLVARS
jgi:serine/threonine-protein kinase